MVNLPSVKGDVISTVLFLECRKACFRKVNGNILFSLLNVFSTVSFSGLYCLCVHPVFE